MIFLSGDRHFGELLKIERAGAYPLYEFTSSPLTSQPVARPDAAERENPDVVPGTLHGRRQFGLIRVERPRQRSPHCARGVRQRRQSALAARDPCERPAFPARRSRDPSTGRWSGSGATCATSTTRRLTRRSPRRARCTARSSSTARSSTGFPIRADRRVEFIRDSVAELDAALRSRGGGLIVLHAHGANRDPGAGCGTRRRCGLREPRLRARGAGPRRRGRQPRSPAAASHSGRSRIR